MSTQTTIDAPEFKLATDTDIAETTETMAIMEQVHAREGMDDDALRMLSVRITEHEHRLLRKIAFERSTVDHRVTIVSLLRSAVAMVIADAQNAAPTPAAPGAFADRQQEQGQ